MRKTKAGIRNKQDWDAADHQRAGHDMVAPPLTLARSNIETSFRNLDVAAKALTRIDEPYFAAQIAQMVNTLQAIVDVLKARK